MGKKFGRAASRNTKDFSQATSIGIRIFKRVGIKKLFFRTTNVRIQAIDLQISIKTKTLCLTGGLRNNGGLMACFSIG